MRIISGTFKGRRIQAPKTLPVRPTTDMSKEALFNILNNQFEFADLKVLDLFSGTGNISYEFASRGSKPITSVDGNFGCVQFIRRTAAAFDMDIHPIKSDVFSFLEKAKTSFDIIFADPPYDLPQKDFEKITELVFEKEILNEDGLLIIEHSKHTQLDHMSHFSYQKNYGGSVFSFFEINAETEAEEFENEDLI
jgi:16S rRNA (guanine966-N2)-methyltransferase